MRSFSPYRSLAMNYLAMNYLAMNSKLLSAAFGRAA
jgi:hypothetical protein